MPARLPDVDLAPAEATPPPGQVVQPSGLGLPQAGEALGQAATIGYRAGAIQERAQALEAQRAVEGPVDLLKQQLLGNANVEKAGYQGEPGLGARMSAEGQSIYDNAYATAQKTMSPIELAMFQRQGQSLLADHQSLSEEIQAAHQATAIEGSVKSQQDAQVQQMALPALDDLRKLDAGLRQYKAGDPNAVTDFKTQGMALATQRFAEATQNMPAYMQQNLAPGYWNAVNRELSEGTQRVGDAVTTYAMANAQDAHQQNINSMIGSVNSAPETYPTVLQSPQFKAEQDALGTSPEAELKRESNERELAKAHLSGLAANQDWDVLNAQLKGHDFDFLGPEKQDFVNEALKHGDNAIDNQTKVATLRGQWDLNVAYHATQGPEGTVSPGDLKFLRENMEPAEYGALIAKTQAADREFAAIGGPIADQTRETLQNIKEPDQALLKSDPGAWQAKEAAYQAAQAQIKNLTDDSAAAMFGIQRGAGKVRPSGPAQPGSVLGMGPRLEQEWAPLAAIMGTDPKNPTAAPQANPQAGQVFWSDLFNGELNGGADFQAGQARSLTKPMAQQIAGVINDALASHPESLPLQAQKLTALFQSAPDQVKLANGLTISAKAQLAEDLVAGGLKEKGLMAAVVGAASGSTAGHTALSMYIDSRSNPELTKPLPAQQGNQLYNNVVKGLGDLTTSMGGPADQKFNQDRIDEAYAIARSMMFRQGLAPNIAAANATALMKADYRFGNGVRMPVAQANASYELQNLSPLDQAAAAAGATFGARTGPVKLSGWELAGRGRDSAKAWVLSGDGENLSLPPSDKASGETLAQYRGIVANNGQWKNFGDGVWKYAVLLNTGQYSIVQDKYHREITLSADQAIKDGQVGSSSFAKPATPLQTTTTPAGHPNNAVAPPQAAAAAGHAIVTHTAGSAAAANQNEPPPPPAPPGGRKIVDVPQGAAAGAEPPAPMNERQALLAQYGADPRVAALFGDQPVQPATPVAAPSTSAGGAQTVARPFVPSHSAAGFDRLNLTPTQARQMFTPAVLVKEHGGAGVQSPKGAAGLYQILPDTAKKYALAHGMPYDPDRLLNDNQYNAQIGQGLLGDLFGKYMVGKNPMAGIALALAGYNAGDGNVDGHMVNGHFHPGYLQRFGDPRAGTMTTDQWIDKLPADKWGQPRDYVRTIYDMTTQRLAAVHGAGPAPGG